MSRLSATALVACGSCATLLAAALLYAGPAFPAPAPRHPAISHSAHPGTHATHPGTHATQPGTYATQPGTHPTQPGEHATWPGTHATWPGKHATRSGKRRTRPGKHATRPGKHATRPGEHTRHREAEAPSGQAIDPALFSAGACVAFAPTSGDRHETVFLDAGHGGLDPGAVGRTQTGAPVNEAAVNLAVELDTMAILRAQGYRVVVSRTKDTDVTRLTPADVDGSLLTAHGVRNDVGARDVCANLAGADVLVGIYMDSGSPDNAGCVTGYDAVRPFSAANLRLATLLQDDVLGALNAQGYDIPSEGVMPDTVLGSALDSAALAYGHLILLGPAKAGYFTTPSQMPGALIEPLFVTDPFEGSIAASAHGQQLIAGALADAINQYFA